MSYIAVLCDTWRFSCHHALAILRAVNMPEARAEATLVVCCRVVDGGNIASLSAAFDAPGWAAMQQVRERERERERGRGRERERERERERGRERERERRWRS
jgi:hypothetical protein